MDTSIFDNTYSEWCKEIPDIIHSLAKNNVKVRLFIDENDVKSWVNTLSGDSTKYDILMWLKAKANTSFLDKCSIPFTENTIKQLYHVTDDNLLKQFRDGKKRYKLYYKDKLFNCVLPPFFMCVYSKNLNNHYNPFCRKDCDVDLDSFFALKEDLMYYANSFICRIPDEEIKKCQEIVTAYYLENTYGFNIKKMLAHDVSLTPIDNTIYQSDYFTSLAKRVILDFFQEKSLHLELPEKYKSLDISSFKKLVTFFSRDEYDFLKKSVTTKEYDDIILNSQNTPDPGYLLMVLLFVKSILSYHLEEISKCEKVCYTSVTDEFPESLQSSWNITSLTQNFIDKILKSFTFSMPNDKSITLDERFLLADIKSVCTDIKVEKEAFSKEPDFMKKLHANVKNIHTKEECDIQDLVSDDDYYPYIIMPSESEILTRLEIYRNSVLDKVAKYRSSQSKDKTTHVSKNRLVSNTPQITSPKLSGTEIRTFKNRLVMLMNNCFNNPTIAEHNDDKKLNYVVRELPTQSKAVETRFLEQKLTLSSINNEKFLLVSLRNCIFLSQLQKISINWSYLYDITLDACLEKLYKKLVDKFDGPDNFRNYISGIYNSEVLEHANKNLCFEKHINFSRIDKKTQKRIVEL